MLSSKSHACIFRSLESQLPAIGQSTYVVNFRSAAKTLRSVALSAGFLRCKFTLFWRWRLRLQVKLRRPETMPRAVAKARAEMKAGARLVSLEFVASALQPTAVVYASEDRPVWVYRLPFIAAKT